MRKGEPPSPPAVPALSRDRSKLPPNLFGVMAATTFATFSTLAGSYQLLF